MSRSPRRGEVWSLDAGIRVLVVSSTVYNEIAGEPTVVVMPVFDTEPDTGFGVDLGFDLGSEVAPGWAAPGLVTSLRKDRLRQRLGQIAVQALTDVNNMLFKILATPDR